MALESVVLECSRKSPDLTVDSAFPKLPLLTSAGSAPVSGENLVLLAHSLCCPFLRGDVSWFLDSNYLVMKKAVVE